MDPTDPVEVYEGRENLLALSYLFADQLDEVLRNGRGKESIFDEDVSFGVSGDPEAAMAAALFSVVQLAKGVGAATGRSTQQVTKISAAATMRLSGLPRFSTTLPSQVRCSV